MDIDSASNVRSLAIFSFYLSTCLSLTVLIIRDLYLQARRQDAKQHASTQEKARHSRRMQLFGALATVSVAITWSYMSSFFALSYSVWALEHSVALPHGLRDAFSPQHAGRLRLGAWLKDVQLFRDAWEVTLESSPRLFWSQPIFFITAAWSIFLGIESKSEAPLCQSPFLPLRPTLTGMIVAHRRKIPHAWAYMVLGQIVAISFAQNLFFLAVLLFPIQSATQVTGKQQAKSVNWTAMRSLYSACVLVTFGSVCSIPYVTGTKSFLPVLLVPHVVLVVPCFLHVLVPASWGVEHKAISVADRYIKSVFEFTMVLAMYCQLKAVADSYFFPPENAHLHRHSAVYPPANHSALLGSNLAMVGSAIHDHPAVSSVGWDALLCSLSYSCWNMF